MVARWEATCPCSDGRNNENDKQCRNHIPRLALEDLFQNDDDGLSGLFPPLFMPIDRDRPRRLESNYNHSSWSD